MDYISRILIWDILYMICVSILAMKDCYCEEDFSARESKVCTIKNQVTRIVKNIIKIMSTKNNSFPHKLPVWYVI